MNVVLETDRDRTVEEFVMERMVRDLDIHATPIRLPRMAACDFLLDYGGKIRTGLEIKTRKETMEKIQGYGGLMLKHRKLTELQDLARVLSISTVIVFAFEDGTGPILYVEPVKVTDVEPVTPPPRRNFRGLACDDEPVVYLDWDRHLKRVL
jgi:hypothetical protein